MLEKEYSVFQEHKDDLFKKFPDKYVIIHNEDITGPFDTLETAIQDAQKKYQVGDFLVQKCSEENHLIERFHSRVKFA